MRVLHLTLSFAEGGRRRAITSLIRGLEEQGVSSDLGCLDGLGCAADEVAGLVGDSLVLNRRKLFDSQALWQLLRFCRHRRIDVIHTHDAASQFTASLMRPALPRVPILMTFHRSLHLESARPFDRIRNALAGACCGAVVTVSEDRRQHFLAENYVPQRKVVCIPNGIDLNRYRADLATRTELRRELGIDERTVLLGACGHFGIEKGIDIVLRAFQHMAERYPSAPAELLVLGKGTPPQRELMEELARRGRGRVHFLGFRPDAQRWFQSLDVFVHAPRQEAFGLVLVEAMATELPVVASRVGGIPEVVRDGRTGFLVPPDCPEELADALAMLVADPAMRVTMGRQGRLIADSEYSAAICARRYGALYQALLGRGGPEIAPSPLGEVAA